MLTKVNKFFQLGYLLHKNLLHICTELVLLQFFKTCSAFFINIYLTFALQNFEKMFAIVKIAGQQFKVSEGQSLYVPHLSGKQGDKLEFPDVLLSSNENKVTTDGKSVVKAEIVDELVKGDKVIAFKMRKRKGFRKKIGHRTQYTQIKITEIA